MAVHAEDEDAMMSFGKFKVVLQGSSGGFRFEREGDNGGDTITIDPEELIEWQIIDTDDTYTFTSHSDNRLQNLPLEWSLQEEPDCGGAEGDSEEPTCQHMVGVYDMDLGGVSVPFRMDVFLYIAEQALEDGLIAQPGNLKFSILIGDENSPWPSEAGNVLIFETTVDVNVAEDSGYFFNFVPTYTLHCVTGGLTEQITVEGDETPFYSVEGRVHQMRFNTCQSGPTIVYYDPIIGFAAEDSGSSNAWYWALPLIVVALGVIFYFCARTPKESASNYSAMS